MSPQPASSSTRYAFVYRSTTALCAILILTGTTILINACLSFLEHNELFGSLTSDSFSRARSNHSATINPDFHSSQTSNHSAAQHVPQAPRPPNIEGESISSPLSESENSQVDGNKNNKHGNVPQKAIAEVGDPSLPGPKFPKQQMFDIDLIRRSEGTIKHRCKFRGKVFGIGLSKTGTSSLMDMLKKTLKYKCTRSPMITCGYYGLYWYMEDAMLPLFMATNDISWLWHSKPLHDDFMQSVLNATAFADAPWNHFYPVYDQLIPANHSKFILTIRDSTRDAVNSNMKMFARNYVSREYGKNSKVQFDYTNFTRTSPRTSGIRVRWKDFWMQYARQYEVHNRDVVEYFTKRGRLDDLLILNIGQEAKKRPYSEQWYKLTNFLGCPNVTNRPLPNTNAGKPAQIDFFPADYEFHWQNYSWPRDMKRVFKLLRGMKGEYDVNTWNQLKSAYGRIYEHKKGRRRLRSWSL